MPKKSKTRAESAERKPATAGEAGVPYNALRDPASPVNRVLPVVFIAIAAVLLLSYLFPVLLGIVGQALRDVSFGLFGWASFLLPVVFVLLSITRKRDVETHALTAKYISAALFLVFLAVLVFVFGVAPEDRADFFSPAVAYENGVKGIGGGFFGSILGFCLITALSTVGTVILFLLSLVFFLISFFNFEPRKFCIAVGKGIIKGARGLFSKKNERNAATDNTKNNTENSAEATASGNTIDGSSGNAGTAEGSAASLTGERKSQANPPAKGAPLGESIKARLFSAFSSKGKQRPQKTTPSAQKSCVDPSGNSVQSDPRPVPPPFRGVRPEPLKPRRATFAAMPDGEGTRPDIDGTVSANTLNPMDYPLDNDIFYADAKSSERFSSPKSTGRAAYDFPAMQKDTLIRNRENDLRSQNPRSLEEYANITVTDPRRAPAEENFAVRREPVGGFSGSEKAKSYGGTPFGFDNFTMPVHPSREERPKQLPGDTPIEQIVPDDDSLLIPRPAQKSSPTYDRTPSAAQYCAPPTSTAAYGGSFGADIAPRAEKPLEKPSDNPYVFANPYISESPQEPVGAFTREVPQYPRREESYAAQEPHEERPGTQNFGAEAARTNTPSPSYGSETSHVTTYYRTPQSGDGEKRQSFDFSRYRYPDISFLIPQDRTDDSSLDEEVAVNMERLIDTLRSYNVVAEPRSTTRGPRVTRYEIKPAVGVRINSITALQNEIAMNLSAESLIIEAPIPGDSAIGIQVPNARTKPVRLRALIDTDAFRNAKSPTTIALGADIAGKHVFTSISEMPHLLVAGATGMGKSVCINTIITSILYKARPDEVRLILVDPKMVEFNIYQGIPHLLVPVINDAKQAIGALNWAVDEMNRRFKLISSVNARDLDGYIDAQRKNPALEPLPRIVIVIDELNDLVLSLKNSRPLDDVICRIAQKARAAGIHLIIGTQRPTVNVITGNIKANIPTRIAFKVAQKVDSTTIIDAVGAEKLLDKGDMLFMRSSKLRRVQCCLVDNTEIEKVVQFLAANSEGNVYDETAMAGIARATNMANQQEGGKEPAAAPENGGHVGGEEKMFWKAVDILLSFDKVSTSLLERKLGVGYGRAAKLIDKMEDLGIVSPQEGKKARELLMTQDEVAELRASLSGRQLFGTAEENDAEDEEEAPF